MKRILTDVDGVLLNWEYAFHCWMDGNGHTPSVADKGLFWSMAKQYGITDEHALGLVAQFNNSAAIGFLPALRDAHEWVRKLNREDGYMFHAITSLSNDEYAIKLRRMNLEKVFGPGVFEHVECLPLGSPKAEYLAQFKDTGYYWLEDSVSNAEDGLKLGLRPLVMEHGYTMHYAHANIPRVRNWSEINDIIAEEMVV